MSPLESTFYVTGGTLGRDALSYVDRQADRDLFEGLLKGEFCYVLTSRQMGKSSLMVRTTMKLRAEGIHVAILDLTAIGQNLTAEQWYDGLASKLGQQLGLEEELFEFWQANQNWGPLQRWMSALERVVLPRLKGQTQFPRNEDHLELSPQRGAAIPQSTPTSEAVSRLVIFIDEIDVVSESALPD